MNEINNIFLEEFKRLDKLCRDIYIDEKGVTSYIDEMKAVSEFESRYISMWAYDLKRLKELRHIRNQLSHEVGTFNIQMCSQNDIDWLKDFYIRILNGSDPLTLLFKMRKAEKEKMKSASEPFKSEHIYKVPTQSKPSTDGWVLSGIFACCGLIIFSIFCIIQILKG